MAQANRDQNRVPTLIGTSSVDNTTPINPWVNPSTHALLVEASLTPAGTQDVNLTEVGGVAFGLGQQLAAASLPIVLTASQLSTLTPLSTVAATQSGVWNITNISGTISLPTGAATAANQSTEISNLQTINSLTPSIYDYISLGYTGSNLTTVVFKSGGSGGTTVSTLTLAYTGSQLDSVTKT